MQKKNYLLTGLCIVSMIFLLALQVYWIKKYYQTTRQGFEKEVNLAFEDALKKEFSNRADSIQGILKKRLLDTSYFFITSKFDTTAKTVIYNIIPAKTPKDRFSSSFSIAKFNKLIDKNNKSSITNIVAEKFTEMLRNEDLENHIVYYRTQELGKFMVEITSKIEFDTAHLRPFLNKYLADRNIYVGYNFMTKKKDSTTNKSSFDPSLLKKYPVITKALPTYRHAPGQNFVRVMFRDPFPYILSNMWLILSSSVCLVLLLAVCFQQLLKSLHKEKRLSAIKNDFISNITHEFKTPIATATVAIEALGDPNVYADKEKSTRYLQHAKNELNRISTLTDKILKLSMYENDANKVKKESIHVEEAIKEMIAVYDLAPATVNFTFENHTQVSHIQADRTQFQHAVSNVIENAIKYGNEPLEIIISCTTDNHHFILSIKDNGPGIPANDIPLVFEKFYRVKENSGKVKGYGLGLNYVQQIMKLHKGWYKINSSARGTELQLAWPI